MEIADAQRDVRRTFLGGFAGQLVSNFIWFGSAVASVWQSPKVGIAILVIGGIFIFPITQLLLRAMGRPEGLPKGHPMNALGMQIAFVLPLTLPLIFAVTAFRTNWFYPAFMIVLGAHYLPFIFLYGMWEFGVLAVLLVFGGVGLGLYVPQVFSAGGWLTASLLLGFALLGKRAALR